MSKELGLGQLLRLQLPVPSVTKTFAHALQLSFDQDRGKNRGGGRLKKVGAMWPQITIGIGGMFTIPSHGWFLALFYPH